MFGFLKRRKTVEFVPHDEVSVFFSESCGEVLDIHDAKNDCGAYTGEPRTDLKARYPDLEVIPRRVAQERIERLYQTTPVQISIDDWYAGLEELLSYGFMSDLAVASFKVRREPGAMACMCYVRLGDRYFKFGGIDSYDHAQMIVMARRFERETEHFEIETQH